MVRLSRLLRIINLVQVYPRIKAKELAEYCEVNERTIYRDLITLIEADIPIVNEGHGKGYVFIGDFKLYPVNWTDEEYQAFVILPNLFEKGTSIPKKFYSAYEKVMAGYFSQKAEREQLGNFLSLIHNKSHATIENKMLQILTQAVLSQRIVEIVYHSFNSNTIRKRRINPYFFIPRKNRLYIVGYCHGKQEIRTFRLNRFKEVNLLDQTFVKDEINIEKYFKYTWSVIRGEKLIAFKVRFSEKIAHYIEEDEYNVKPIMSKQDDGSLMFEVILNDDKEFIRWLMQYGSEAEILEPKEYRQKLQKELELWNALYQDTKRKK